MELLLAGVGIQLLAGVAACVFAFRPLAANVVGSGGSILGSAMALTATILIQLDVAARSLRLPWDAAHGAFAVEVDSLSAFFLIPSMVLAMLATAYGAGYLYAYRSAKSLGAHWFFFNAFVAGMTLVVVARTALLFLVAWEAMSVAAFCLVTFEHEKRDVRKAGWVYLVAAHLSVAFIFLAFVLLGQFAGSFEFDAFRATPLMGEVPSGIVFVLALIGFGTKAGFAPLHVWLPEAHPAAPSHVSAMMSGVMIKMGVYGLLRVETFLGPPAPWWGATLGGIGLFTGIIGVVLASQQRDVKRVLAYSSIENMGLIGLALGVGLWGQSHGDWAIASLGIAAGLLHIWNHAAMKALMFFTVGSVLHSTGLKDLERLGGALKRMPWTGAGMMVGATAIAALPPLNGFASKWLIYMGLLKCGLTADDSRSLPPLFAVALLTMIGAMAGFTFVRLTGIALLGSPRSAEAKGALESSPWLVGPIALLAVLCVFGGAAPQLAMTVIAAPLEQIAGHDAAEALRRIELTDAPIATVGTLNAGIAAVLIFAAAAYWMRSRKSAANLEPTWGCGFALPTVRMQYTARSFGEMVDQHLLPGFLGPRSTARIPRGLFPGKTEFETEYPEPFSESGYEPFFRRWAKRFARLRILQQGKVHVYLIYILATVVFALTWLSIRKWFGAP